MRNISYLYFDKYNTKALSKKIKVKSKLLVG